ncbi:malto-oligosyltrehalose synthase [Aeromicrobium chenweiae]|uniref:Malto-oligosyltrehalose synthase n=1 Tax=Aeromicrobium chenweiae TaxID=2079793 RepID=A0A2S0WNJ6_9ACTN|nr:malto-oligosyltrehalose synthase [Aeromicrobium chenweiae]AWB92918.1 malto-oligosyltrehalose synthase [Aeromicrobium chenweiae]TGN33913.1 malto-oligosyltrehalose synthase [Aeromicrobium chenweiae]
MTSRSTPSSTYRLQMRPEFGFRDAEQVVSYLGALGIGAVYVSPVLDATPGSTHGYDVTDPSRARPELGGEEGRLALADAVRAEGMGLVVDIVPNHMSVEVPSANPWWWSVLRDGSASPYAHHFDIDWSRERILVPVLGSADDLAALTVEGDELVYYDHRFPVSGSTEGTPQEVHDRQHYELVDWRRGNAELSYRRFFDITTLAAVTVERPEVFDDVHREVLRWVGDGDVTGLRVDHPDGLADPTAYVRRLREAAPDAWIVIEKILHPGEALPGSWPVEGTTGYDALGDVSGVLLDPAGEAAFTQLAARLGVPTDYAAVEEEARRLVTDSILVAEVRRIAALLQDVEVEAARAAVAETMIAFGVYRSYLPEVADEWAAAIVRATARRPDLGEALAALDEQVRADPAGELATRIQQTSGMVVAKGTEDTTFYRFTRFAALNEVGGSPDRWGVGVDEFHRLAAVRDAGSPATMTTLTTHDTKRSEDTRARMAVLAEVADEFAELVTDWHDRCGIDEPSLDLLAWQTLVGASPISDERLSDYLLKAAKEAKLRTTWTEPDEEFEQTVVSWPARVRAELGEEVDAFVKRITPAGWSNSLSAKLLQLAGPGVPDVYQGTELWDFSLVDPDNRREVDYDLRRELLDRFGEGLVPEIDRSGAAKMLVVHRVLTLRRDRPELFRGYTPLRADGPAAEHAVAFARSDDLVAVATRLPIGLERRGGWGTTSVPLPEGRWTDVITGAQVEGGDTALADVLDRYPVALLVKEGVSS